MRSLILSLIGSLFEAAGKIVSTIWDKITNTEWFQKGAEVLTKIINGIKSISLFRFRTMTQRMSIASPSTMSATTAASFIALCRSTQRSLRPVF